MREPFSYDAAERVLDVPPAAASTAVVPPVAISPTTSGSRSVSRSDLAFWALLGVMLGLLLAPIWMAAMPPLTDFGGHTQVAHGFARLGDGVGGAWPNIWSDVIERRDVWWLPNLLAVRMADVVYPLLDALTAMRLVTTLSLVMTVLGHVFCLQTFGRSRWFVFLALPVLVWNGMVGLGFINYYLGLACVPWALALARRIGDADRLPARDVVLLGLVTLVAFFAHGFAALVVMAAASVILAVSVRRFTRVFAGLTMLPAAALWLHWYFETRSGVDARVVRVAFGLKLDAIARESIDLFEGNTEENVLVVLALAALFVVASGILWEPERLARAGRGLWAGLRARALWILLALLLVAYFALPTYLGDLVVSERLIPIFVAVACLLPRASVERAMTRVSLGVAMLATVFFGLFVAQQTMRFEAAELRPALALIDMIPKGVRAQCVDVQYARPIFYRRPLDHGCDGLIAVRRDSYAGGGFADTAHNAVAIRAGRPEKRLFDNRWSRPADLAHIDWLLARGRASPPAAQLVETVAWIDDPDTGQRQWTLYRSLLAGLSPAPFEDVRGGPGGQPLVIDCPVGHALASVTVGLTKDQKLVQAVGAECSQLIMPEYQGDIATLATKRVRLPAPTTPGAGGRRTLTCSGHRPVIGFALRAALYVDAAALACAPDRVNALWLSPFGIRLPEIGSFRGGNGGQPDEVICPDGMIATGIRGRTGGWIDALGVACRTLESIHDDAIKSRAPSPP